MHVPLLGTLIIAVFRRMNSLPENKVKLYEMFVDLMCGGWDLAKNVARETNFGSGTKVKILTSLAGSLHVNNKREASEWEIRIAVSKVAPALTDETGALVNEVLEDGLLMRVSSGIVFSHLSFQEFLAAKDLNDPSGMRQANALRAFFRGNDWWREVLAFYIALSSRPEELEGWIVRIVNGISHNLRHEDFTSRCDFLFSKITENCPGWTPDWSKLPRSVQRGLQVSRGRPSLM
jgi:predicted NACHT family NTPase